MNTAVARALLARPLVLCLGALGSVWLTEGLRSGSLVAWIAGIFGGLNLLFWLARDLRPALRVAYFASPLLGCLGWGALATFTGGLESPFVAGFFFELALATVSMAAPGVAWVVGISIAVLMLVHALHGWPDGGQLFFLEAGFLGLTGALAALVAHRRIAGESALQHQGDELGARLEALQRQLEDERVVSRVGENVARLAHGLKNAVHSLRGFVGLIEPELAAGGRSRAALVGLRAAIDDLEKLARLTLSEAGGKAVPEARPASSRQPETDARRCRVVPVVDAALLDMGRASPGVGWTLARPPESETWQVPLPQETFLELLIILMRNGVESMSDHGAGRVILSPGVGACVLVIEDEGPGFAAETLSRIFEPGYTTKPGGSGFGLFLARRIVEDRGGRLSLENREGGGGRVRVELPLAEPGSQESDGVVRGESRSGVGD